MKELLNKKTVGMVILVIILTTVSTYYFFPRVIHLPSKATVVVDSEAVARAIKERDDIILEKDGFIARLLHSHTQGVPQIAIGRPAESPLSGTVIHDTVWTSGGIVAKEYKLYAYDFPMSGTISDDEIRLTTINPYLESTGEKYVKEYTFQREADNFRFALNESKDEQDLAGIRLIFDNKPIVWKGIFVGGALGFPTSSYAYLKGRLELYSRLAIQPELRTSENFLWLVVEWKMN